MQSHQTPRCHLNQTCYPSMFLARVSRRHVWALHWCPQGPGSSKWSPLTKDSGTKDPPQRRVRPEGAEPPRPRGQALLLAAGSAVCTPFTKGCLPAATCQRTQVLEMGALTTSELALSPPSPCARAGEGSHCSVPGQAGHTVLEGTGPALQPRHKQYRPANPPHLLVWSKDKQ